MTAGLPSRSEADLTVEEQKQLAAAHVDLRAAVAAYEEFLGSKRRPEVAVPVAAVDRLRKAQERVERAEERLWELREQLLGWHRPAWAPSASLVSDWFSDEDADYDALTDSARS